MATELERSREVAARQIQHIKLLRESEAFNNYWLYRLKQRHATALDSLIHDPATKIVTRKADGKETQVEIPFCTKERREEIRQLVLAYEDLLRMMDMDYNSAAGLLTELPPGVS
jgi:hypothetical protein